MNRKYWDYKKYGGRLNPNSDVFFGPITLRELKKSVEMAELLKLKKKTKMDLCVEPIHEITENHELNTTFNLTDDNENIDLFPTISELDDSKNKIIKNHSYLPSVPAEPLTDISNTNGILATTFEDLKINEPQNLSNISVNLIKNISTNKKCTLLDDTFPTFVKAHLQTPLIDKMAKVGVPNTVAEDDNDIMVSPIKRTETNGNSSLSDTPCVTKLSNTFITELLPENCLVNTTFNDDSDHTNTKNQSTPEIFQQKRNNIWKKNDSKKSVMNYSFKSKLPQMRKTPNAIKYLNTKSPVADYIHRGLTVQSMSKLRHSHCVVSTSDLKSKSDNKTYKSCKIPVSTHTVAKRKLILGEQMKTSRK